MTPKIASMQRPGDLVTRADPETGHVLLSGICYGCGKSVKERQPAVVRTSSKLMGRGGLFHVECCPTGVYDTEHTPE